MEPVFTGVCTALVTPFTSAGSVNYPVLARMIERQIGAGVDALCVCGTTGESAALSLREHVELTRFCVEQVRGRVKVIAGAGSNDTASALYLSRRALESGADALLLVTPYYNKTTQAGLVRHFTHIADRVDLPAILYNVPTRTGMSFTAGTYAELAGHPRIRGIKEASGDLGLISHTLARCGDALTLWSGNDDQTVPIMALGGGGVISVAANLIPETMVRLTRLCMAGDFLAAARLQLELLPLTDALFSEVNPIPVKTAMELLGWEPGPLRLPLCPMGLEHRDTLRAALSAQGLL